jgi:hypothetical protein
MCYNLAENVKLYFLHICVNIWNGLYLVYMFWMDFHFYFRNFLEDLFFFKSLCMLALLCSAPIFQHYKHYFAPHLKYNVFLLSDWKNNSLLLYSYNQKHPFKTCDRTLFFPLCTPGAIFFRYLMSNTVVFRIVHYVREVTRWCLSSASKLFLIVIYNQINLFDI